MDKQILKKTAVISLVSGAILGLLALVPSFIIVSFLFLMFMLSPLILSYLKYREYKEVFTLDNKLLSFLGSFIGFFATIGFFVLFSPMAFILKTIFKNNYFYGLISVTITDAFWLFLVCLGAVCFLFSSTNAIMALGAKQIFNYFENIIGDNGRDK